MRVDAHILLCDIYLKHLKVQLDACPIFMYIFYDRRVVVMQYNVEFTYIFSPI